MRLIALFKYFKNKKEFSVIILLICVCTSLFGAITSFANSIQPQYVQDYLDNEYVDFTAISNNYNKSHPYFINYIDRIPGFQITHNFELDYARFRFVDIKFTNIDENLTKNYDYDSIYFLGLSEDYFNYLNQVPNNHDIKLPETWDLFSNRLFFSNLELNESSNIENFKVINQKENEISITNDPVILSGIENNSVALNLTTDISILDEEHFMEIFFEQWHTSESKLVIIGDNDAIKSIVNQNMNIQFSGGIFSADIFVFDHDILNNLKQNELTSAMSDLQEIGIFHAGEFKISYAGSPWYFKIIELERNRENFIFTMWIFYLPVIIFAYKLIKYTISMIFENNRQEISLFVYQSISKKEIKKYYNRFLMGLGFSGGIIGGLIGFLFSFQLSKSWYSEFSLDLISYFNYFDIQTILSIGLYGLISAFLVRQSFMQAFKPFDNQELSEMVSIGKKFKIHKSKIQFLFDLGVVLLSILTLSVYIFTNLNFNKENYIDFEKIQHEANYLYIILWFLLIFMYAFPFILPISLIRLFFQNGFLYYQKIVKLFIKPFNKLKKEKSKKLTQKHQNKRKITQNIINWQIFTQSEKQRYKVELFTILLIFTTMFFSLTQSYSNSRDIYESSLAANGTLLYLDLSEAESLNILENEIDSIKWESEKYGIDSMNTIFHTNYRRDNYSIDFPYISHFNKDYRFSTLNYSHLLSHVTFLDEWFIGGSPEEIMEKMNQEDAMLIPEMFLGIVSLNSSANFSITHANGSVISQTGRIIGAYSNFPTQNSNRHQFDEDYMSHSDIFVNSKLLDSARIKEIDVMLYSDSIRNSLDIPEIQIFQVKKIIFQEISAEIKISVPNFNRNKYDAIYIDMLNLESYVIFIFGVIGLFLFSFYAFRESLKHNGMLRALGFCKNDIKKMKIEEILRLITFSALISLLSFIIIPILLFGINFQRSDLSNPQFSISKVNNSVVYVIISIIGAILFFAINLGFNIIALRKTDVKRNLDQILRGKY